VEVDADMVEEKLEEEATRRKRMARRRRRASTLIKSNNPHLAGGEKHQVSPKHGQNWHC
jgi:hypothetical protein